MDITLRGISTREEINQQILTFVQDNTVSDAHCEDDGPRQINIDHPLLDELYEIEDTIDLHVPSIVTRRHSMKSG